MGISLNKAFSVDATALQLRSARAQVLAADLVNADTPGYLARDIDFSAAMSAAMHDGTQAKRFAGLRVTHPDDIGAGGGDPLAAIAAGALRYQVPLQPSVDGNTVDANVARAAFTDNAIRYQAALNFLTGTIKQLQLALKGS